MRCAYVGTLGGDGLVVADVVDGRWSTARALPEVAEPSWVVGGGGVTYVVNERRAGAVTALDTTNPEKPVVLQERETGGLQPTHATTFAGHLVVAHYLDGTVGAHPLGPDGAIGPRSTGVRHGGARPHAHQVVADPSGRWLVAVDLGADAVLTHRFDGWELVEHARFAVAPGLGPRHLAFHGTRAYVLGEERPELVALDWDPAGGTFTEAWTHALPPGNHPGEIALSPDGRLAYLTLRGDNTIAVVDLHARTTLQQAPAGGDWPRHCLLLDDGQLLVANQRSGTVTRLAVDTAGLLGRAETVLRAAGASVLHLPG
ncbi:lactonase family protein [Actinokineospora bangkokensis]|uniref:3-carboxymuconate cyclase n=1 Tax=Actinokineospora bangkokensis TaxID=1193682 RepID=A0A1Q9LJA3_9PSEU|nr:beta-propeller fold lactonase family protein [Actinokineospora bangkokensis]OLR92059.1 hypothetical protein BJP25_22145 [Actinokineospora bangkokensis]